MTSLLRRKRPTTARRITPARTIASLLGAAWLATGTASAADATAGNPTAPGLYPLAGQASPVPHDPPTLMPVARPMTAAAGPLFYYQKDADSAKTAGAIPAAYQAPDTPKLGPQVPESAALPASAINTVPPTIGQIPAQTELQLQQSIVTEVESAKQSEIFRTFPITYYDKFPKDPYAARTYQPTVERVDPNYVCYERLYFEDKNSERYGWELGMLQPLVSVGKFYLDVAMFPYNLGTRPCQRFEADAGYCLPGDPVPYLIYPVELSLAGGVLEAGTIVGLAAIFP